MPGMQSIILRSVSCSLYFVCIPNSPHSLLQCFAAVIIHIHDPKTTTLIFASGKMIVTGLLVRMGVGIVFYVFGVELAKVLEEWLACAWVDFYQTHF